MIEFVELTVFLIGMVTIFFIRTNNQIYEHLPEAEIFIVAFYLLFSGWFFSIVEGFFLHNLFNHIEHILYALSNITLAIWCYRVFIKKKAR